MTYYINNESFSEKTKNTGRGLIWVKNTSFVKNYGQLSQNSSTLLESLGTQFPKFYVSEETKNYTPEGNSLKM